MIDKTLRKLNFKHLLIIGGTEFQRKKLVDELINQANLAYFRFPKKLKTINEYVEFVRKFNLYQPWYTKRDKFGTNQILDFHRDWMLDNNSLIILEEFQEMEEIWKLDVLKSYLNVLKNRIKGEKAIHLIVTQESEGDLLEQLEDVIVITQDEKRTKREIINGAFEIIRIS